VCLAQVHYARLKGSQRDFAVKVMDKDFIRKEKKVRGRSRS
jgi:hypothetical protein